MTGVVAEWRKKTVVEVTERNVTAVGKTWERVGGRVGGEVLKMVSGC